MTFDVEAAHLEDEGDSEPDVDNEVDGPPSQLLELPRV
jgi:hypothetical protein